MLDDKTTKKNRINNFINIIFLFIFLLVIFGGFVKPIIDPNEINYYENRTAEYFEKVTLEKILDNEVQDNIEATYADQIPLTFLLKRTYNAFTSLTTKIVNSNIYASHKNEYLPLNDLYLFNDHIVYYYGTLESNKDAYDKRIKNLNEYFAKYTDIDFYVYYVEKDTDINFETNEKMGIYEYLRDNLNVDNISRFEIDSYEDFAKSFYKTDHHWNYYGSYNGYLGVAKLLGIEDVIEPTELVDLHLRFMGSKGSSAASSSITYSDEFYAYKFDLKPHKTYVNGNEQEYSDQEGYFNGLYNSISYGDFYGYDYALVEFDYEDPNKENILVIGESYDNAIIPLIASNYNKTFSVDLRHNTDFEFDKFVKENNITKVLLIGNSTFFVMESCELKN